MDTLATVSRRAVRGRRPAAAARRIHALGVAREGDDVLALGQRRAHIPDRGLRVGGDEEAGRVMVRAQVRLQGRAGGRLRGSCAAPPDLLGLGGELFAQLVEIAVPGAVEAGGEEQVQPGQAVWLALVLAREVPDDDPSGEVRARQARQRAGAGAHPLEVRAQVRLGAGRDGGEDGERPGLARAIGIAVTGTSALGDEGLPRAREGLGVQAPRACAEVAQLAVELERREHHRRRRIGIGAVEVAGHDLVALDVVLETAGGQRSGEAVPAAQNSVMPRVRMWEKASMYSSQPPLKLLSKNRCGWRRRCSGSCLTSVQRAKWMNDSRASVPCALGTSRA